MTDAYWTVAVTASALLVASGILKLRHPTTVVPLLALLRVPHALRRGRLVGVVEMAVGAGAIVTGSGALLAVQALLFFGFAAVVLYVLLAHVPLASCGCAGARPTPPSVIHVCINGVAASASWLAAWAATSPAHEVATALGWIAAPVGLGICAAAVFTLALMGLLAEALHLSRRVRAAGFVYRPIRS